MQKLREAIKQSGLSNAELSVKLGHSKKYLTNALLKGVSTAKQEELINDINDIVAGTFKTDVEVIAELTERLNDVRDLASNRLTALQRQQKECTKLRSISASLIEESDNYFNANTELNAELNTMRKNAQEADEALKLFKDGLDYIKLEKDKLRETVDNQNDLNNALNEENAKLAEKLGFAKKEIHNLELENQVLKRTNKINGVLAFLCLVVIIILTCINWSV